jgi:hypothetical protein
VLAARRQRHELAGQREDLVHRNAADVRFARPELLRAGGRAALRRVASGKEHRRRQGHGRALQEPKRAQED